MFDVLHKYHAGDTGLVREINANAAFNAGVNQMAREELGMPAEAQPQLQVIGMQYLGSLVQGMQITTQQLEVSNRQVEMSGRLVQSLTLERDGLALERSGLMTLATQLGADRDAFKHAASVFQAENLAIRNESVAWRNMVEQTHGQSVDALKTQYVYAMEALKAQYTVDMDALKAQHAEELKKHSEDAVQKALGRTIKISEVALEMGHIVEPNSAEALQIGVKLKKLFKDQMGMEPGHVAREYRNGEMVACAYYVRDKELVRRAVESVMGPAIPNVRFVYSVN